MKKNLLSALVLGLSVTSHAAIEDVYSTPKAGYVKAEKKYAIAGGYTNSKFSLDGADADLKFKGYFVNLAIASSVNYSGWFEYSNQKFDEELTAKMHEFTGGIQYRLYDGIRSYAAVGGGIGYSTLKAEYSLEDNFGTTYRGSEKYNYVTLPLHAEAGFYALENVSVFGNVGYKWMFSLDESSEEECYSSGFGTNCIPSEDRASENDLDGFNYKFGVRFHF